jgi:hypothetical protein
VEQIPRVEVIAAFLAIFERCGKISPPVAVMGTGS